MSEARRRPKLKSIPHVFLLIAALVFFAVPPMLSAEPPENGGEPAAEEDDMLDELLPPGNTEEIKTLLSSLRDAGGDEEREIQRKILEFGREALPLVEEELKKDPYDQLHYLHSQLVANLEPENGPGDREPDANPFNDDPDDPYMKPPEAPLPQVDKDTVKKYLLTAYEEAKKQYRAGNYELAETIARAILTIEPETSMNEALNLFMTRCRQRMLREAIAYTEIKLSHYACSWENVLKVTFVIRNVSGRDIIIPAKITIPEEHKPLFPDLEGTETSGYYTVKIREYDELGQMNMISEQFFFKLDSDIVLAPNATWTHTVEVPTSSATLVNKKVLRLFKIEGTIIAQKMPVHKSYMMSRLRFPPQIAKCFPVIFERDLDAPEDAPEEEKVIRKTFVEFIGGKALDYLRAELAKPASSAYGEIFMAAQLLKYAELRDGIDLLTDELEFQGMHMRTAIMAALKALTGRSYSANPNKWRYWWKNTRERFTSEMIDYGF